MKTVMAVIPARYGSSRFPGKPLAMIAGKPMIQRVYEQVKRVEGIKKVIVATDDVRICDTVKAFRGEVVMTGECGCGTERVYEAIQDEPCDIVINVQGDEPLIKPEMIRKLISAFEDGAAVCATLCKEIMNRNEIDDTSVVKVVKDKKGDALYFSRYAIPFNRDCVNNAKYFKHIGIYGYTKEFLKTYVNLPKTPLESAESLEQLRVLEQGYKIRVLETAFDSIGVDNPEDVLRVEKEIIADKES